MRLSYSHLLIENKRDFRARPRLEILECQGTDLGVPLQKHFRNLLSYLGACPPEGGYCQSEPSGRFYHIPIKLWVTPDYEHHLRHAYRDVVNLPVGGLTLGNCCWVVALGVQPKYPSYEREQCHNNLPFICICLPVEVLQFGGESLHLNKKLIYIYHTCTKKSIRAIM